VISDSAPEPPPSIAPVAPPAGPAAAGSVSVTVPRRPSGSRPRNPAPAPSGTKRSRGIEKPDF
jgi:hypothetical protein